MPMFTQNMFTYGLFNPAYHAATDDILAFAVVREQWAGLKDSDGNRIGPSTLAVGIQTPVEFLNGGVGGSIIQDKIGYFSDIRVNLGGAFSYELRNGTLNVGLQVNFTNRKIDFNKFKPLDPSDPVIGQTGENSSLLTDFGLGVFYEKEDRYYFGASAINILEAKGSAYTDGSDATPVNDRTLYAMGGIHLRIPSAPLMRVTPSVMIRSNLVQTQISLSGLVTYNNKFWGGVTYNVQSGDAFGVILGFMHKSLRIGYAYDLPLSQINRSGSHEIILTYRFKWMGRAKTESYRNTRFL